jgi:hypothetical protein
MDSEILDDKGLDQQTVDITFKNGGSFSPLTRVVSIIFLLIGLGMLASGEIFGFIIGPAIIFGAGFIITSNFGTDVCVSSKYVREYHERFFIKSGKWVPTNLLTDICVIKVGKNATRSDMTGSVSTEIDISKNEIVLLSANHRKRILLRTCNSSQEAAEKAVEIAEILDKKFTKFNPQISKKTQERLRHRR